MATAIIVQARTGSTRLPGKVLKKNRGKTLLEILLQRLKQVKNADEIIVATTVKKADKAIIAVAKNAGVKWFAGSEKDVLDRYYRAAKKVGATTVVRITSDCPLTDPKVIDEVIKLFFEKKVDYASNVEPRSYPHGFDTEVFSFKALQIAWKNAKSHREKEHVTPYIRESKKFTKANLLFKKNLSKIRLTLDYPEDFIVIKQVYEKIKNKKNFDLSDLMKVLEKNPGITKLNEKYE